MNKKLTRIIWVALVAASAFVLGYTLKPAPARKRIPPFMLMQQMGAKKAPPLTRYYRR